MLEDTGFFRRLFFARRPTESPLRAGSGLHRPVAVKWNHRLLSGSISRLSKLALEAKNNNQKPVRRFVLYSLRHTFLTRLGESGAMHGPSQGSPGWVIFGFPLATFIHPKTRSWRQCPALVGTKLGTLSERPLPKPTRNSG
jgi:hypothetical protein